MNKCIICGCIAEMKEYKAYEMMYGTREEFIYVVCPECGCLQLANIPSNIGEYYKNDYYSYKSRNGLKTATKTPENDYRILDVGCGSGEFLCNIAKEGYSCIHGCDPFIDSDIDYENGVKVYKKEIHDMHGEYDMIFMNDSFEHVTDPHEVFESAYRLLSNNGMMQIQIPVFPNIAFETYGVNWYQLDAPRHIVLHSKKSIEILAAAHNFKVIQCVWDSNNGQLGKSYLYSLGIPFCEMTQTTIDEHFSAKQLEDWEKLSIEANANEYGDHAIFNMVKTL